MKKLIALLLITIFVFAATGCTKKEINQPKSQTNSLAGYMVIEGNSLYLDEVEVITQDDKDRIAELELDQQADMPSGYYIYNPNKEKFTYELTNQTVYTFVDFNLLFVKNEEGNRLYTTTKKEEFMQHLNATYSDVPPAQKVPLFIEVNDGKVISVTEKFEFTI